MAKQRSIIKLEGTIGDITFLKTRDGYLAKEKTSISAERIATDPAFERTRENGAEFARAGKAGKLVRAAFRSVLKGGTHGRLASRLTTEMMRVIKADTTSVRGMRNVIDGEAQLLQGFDFNEQGALSSTLFAPFVATIDRVAGTLRVSIPPFVPNAMIGYPAGATHFRIAAAGAAIDFEQEQFEQSASETALLPLDATATQAVELVNNVTENSTHPMLLILGIEFYQEVNGLPYTMRNGAYNALQIVKVD
jgi:hypothetical protein